MATTIHVRPSNDFAPRANKSGEVLLFERHMDHPKRDEDVPFGEVLINTARDRDGKLRVFECAPTPAVQKLINEQKLIEVTASGNPKRSKDDGTN